MLRESTKKMLTNAITKNYRQNDSDFIKGYIQGIITATTNNKNKKKHNSQKTYHRFKSFIHKPKITPSDKGGGIVIMDTHTYLDT